MRFMSSLVQLLLKHLRVAEHALLPVGQVVRNEKDFHFRFTQAKLIRFSSVISTVAGDKRKWPEHAFRPSRFNGFVYRAEVVSTWLSIHS